MTVPVVVRDTAAAFGGEVRAVPVLLPRLQLMGEFALEVDGHPVNLPQSARRLLAFLAVHDHPLARTFAAGSLWPEVPQERAAGNLRSTLWRLRQAGAAVVQASPLTVSLDPTLTVDLHELLRDAGASVADEEAPDLPERFGADLLPDWYDDWLVVTRERLRQLRLHAMEALCARFLERGMASRAIDVALTAVAVEPLRESAHRILVQAHLAEGNVGEALREYRSFSALLDDELGIRPSAVMHELVQPLLHRPSNAVRAPEVDTSRFLRPATLR